MSDRIAFFQKIPLFASLSPDELNDILCAPAPRDPQPGEPLFREAARRPAPRPAR